MQAGKGKIWGQMTCLICVVLIILDRTLSLQSRFKSITIIINYFIKDVFSFIFKNGSMGLRTLHK